MKLLSEEQELQAYFERTIGREWGWDNFRKDKDGMYVANIVRTAWFAFKHGVYVGKQLTKPVVIYHKEESDTPE